MTYFLGRYLLVDPIGEGGMGSVWRAWDAQRRGYVAAKLLRPADAGTLLRFVREQSLRVAHPHVVAPTGWAADDDRVLLTMDLVRGGSVGQLLGDYGSLPLWYAAVLVDQLLDALVAVHACGIVHRDVKPSNLLLEPTGRGRPVLRLADFGIAALLGEPRLTETHLRIGSPGYVAPECVTGGAEPDVRQDLYAVGKVATRLLGGGTSPDGRDRLPEDLPDPVRAVLRSLLAVSPTDRPPTAAAARRAWSTAIEAAAVPPIDPDDPDAVEVFEQIGPLPDGFAPDGPLATATSILPPRPERGRPPAPADSPGPLAHRLTALWLWAGRPSEEVLRALAGTRPGTGDFAVDSLPAGALDRLLTGHGVPPWELVEGFVAACLRAGNHPSDQVADEVARWRAAGRSPGDRHTDGPVVPHPGSPAGGAPTATPPGVGSGDVPSGPGAPGRDRLRALTTPRGLATVTAGCVALLLAGVSAVAWYPSDDDVPRGSATATGATPSAAPSPTPAPTRSPDGGPRASATVTAPASEVEPPPRSPSPRPESPAPTAAARNLLPDPGVEASPPGWATFGTGVLTRVTTARSGSHALRVTTAATGANSAGATNRPVIVTTVAGRTYRASCWVRASANVGAYVQVQEYTSSWKRVSAAAASPKATLDDPGRWYPVSVTYTAAGSGNQLPLSVFSNGLRAGGAELLVDDCALTEV